MSLFPQKITAVNLYNHGRQNAAAGASVSITDTSGALISLYGDKDGLRSLPNPFFCDQNGEKQFWTVDPDGFNVNIYSARSGSWGSWGASRPKEPDEDGGGEYCDDAFYLLNVEVATNEIIDHIAYINADGLGWNRLVLAPLDDVKIGPGRQYRMHVKSPEFAASDDTYTSIECAICYETYEGSHDYVYGYPIAIMKNSNASGFDSTVTVPESWDGVKALYMRFSYSGIVYDFQLSSFCLLPE